MCDDGEKRNIITHLYSFPSSRRFNWVRQLCSFKCFISCYIWALKGKGKKLGLILLKILAHIIIYKKKSNYFIFSKNKFLMYQRTLRPELSEEMKRIKSLSLQNLIFNAIFFANISGRVWNLSILNPISRAGREDFNKFKFIIETTKSLKTSQCQNRHQIWPSLTSLGNLKM